MKLHLGCGQRYLDGYINIDFPSSSHSIQETSVADLHADILSLHYPEKSVEEIRSHHVFEHFPRPIACALLAGWYLWLKEGGLLRIEVPDFRRTAQRLLNPFLSFKKRAVAERHLYGSHEAPWAVHCEGYTPEMLRTMLQNFGFHAIKTRGNAWQGTYNFEVYSVKSTGSITPEDFEQITLHFLSNFLLCPEGSEAKLLSTWLNLYRTQVQNMLTNKC